MPFSPIRRSKSINYILMAIKCYHWKSENFCSSILFCIWVERIYVRFVTLVFSLFRKCIVPRYSQKSHSIMMKTVYRNNIVRTTSRWREKTIRMAIKFMILNWNYQWDINIIGSDVKAVVFTGWTQTTTEINSSFVPYQY